MGLLPIETIFAKDKTRTQTEGRFDRIEGIFAGLNGQAYRGYEIHMGQSGDMAAVAQSGNAYGSYIHGIFDENGIAQTIIRALCGRRGIVFDENTVFDVHAYKNFNMTSRPTRCAARWI